MGIHLDRAWHFFQQARYDLAEREARQEMASDPNNASAHALLGMCLTEAKQQDAALAEAEEAIRLRPDMAYGHYVRAFILCNRDQMEPAAAAIQEALRLEPEDADYFALLSYVRAAQARWQESLDTAESGLRLSAEHVDCANRRALALVNLGRSEEAVTTIEAALARDPENPRTFANRGWVHLQKGDPVHALQHFRDAMRISPRLKSVRQGVVDALLQLVQKRQQFPNLGPFETALHHDPELEAGRQKIVEALLGRWRQPWGGLFGLVLLLGWIFVVPFAGSFESVSRDHPKSTLLLLCTYLAGIALNGWFFSSRLADPLYCLPVRLNRLGSRLLTPDQVLASTWVGACLLLGVILLVGSVVVPLPLFLFGGAALLFLMVPLAKTFQVRTCRARHFMMAYTILLGVLWLSALILERLDVLAVNLPGLLFLVGVGASNRVGDLLSRAAQNK